MAADKETIETYIDTGSLIFNGLVSGSLSGGVSSNRITAIAGETSTGKTYFALAVVKNFLDNNPDAYALYFDTESAKGAIAKCLEIADEVIFCNGGDRGKENTPEVVGYSDNDRVKFEYGVGGTDKLNSSSWILHNYFNRQRKLLGI